MDNAIQMPASQVLAENQRFIVKVYAWMSVAMIVTGLVALWTASTPSLINFIMANNYVFVFLLVVEIVLVGFLAGWVMKISAQTAAVIFILYSILNGLTLSFIFLIFTTRSIESTFFITAGTFAVMSLVGYYTKTDLTRFGNLLVMCLVGLIIATLVNLFFQNEMIYWITTFAGILIFTGLIAYDTQKIKNINIIGDEGTEADKKEAIIGALALYLDFINLFLMLLRLFGKRK